jgi:hypothetical protein
MRPSLSPLLYGAYGTSFREVSVDDGGPHVPPSESGKAAMSDESWNAGAIVEDYCGGGVGGERVCEF